MPPSFVARLRQPAAPPSAAGLSDAPALGAGTGAATGADAAVCPSCGAVRAERFCPRCGERRVDADDYTLRHFAAHAVDQIFNLDGTLWRTLRALVARPGLLTAEYLAGRRTRYTRPLQLFLLVNVAFFLATGALGTFRFRLAQYERGTISTYALRDTARVRALVAAKARREGTSVQEISRRFDAASAAQQSVWLLLAPGLAGVLAALYARRRLPYVHHLVFAVHALAFLLFATGAAITGLSLTLRAAWAGVRALRPAAPAAAGAIAATLDFVGSENVWAPALLAWVAGYLVFAVRRVYRERWPWALARALVVAACLQPLFDLYRDLLFFVTYLSV